MKRYNKNTPIITENEIEETLRKANKQERPLEFIAKNLGAIVITKLN